MKGKEADSVLVDKGENRVGQECRKESHFSNSLAVLCIPIIMYFSSYAYSLTPQWPHLSLPIHCPFYLFLPTSSPPTQQSFCMCMTPKVSWVCLHEHGCGAVSWSMANFPVAVPLKKMASTAPQPRLPVSPALGVGSHELFLERSLETTHSCEN